MRERSWMAGLVSSDPASNKVTCAPESTIRRATTAPAEPAPTTMTDVLPMNTPPP
ncbi:hypothetical protein [Glutamicibacter nicotianae]|uniref:hypothetical protein n=1 Tax=Glutamicibacter nicotianae TaxID=37929 RepID=UPI00195E19D3|nr:hypothetical protein [Glutamicibacter nicotianae]